MPNKDNKHLRSMQHLARKHAIFNHPSNIQVSTRSTVYYAIQIRPNTLHRPCWNILIPWP